MKTTHQFARELLAYQDIHVGITNTSDGIVMEPAAQLVHASLEDGTPVDHVEIGTAKAIETLTGEPVNAEWEAEAKLMRQQFEQQGEHMAKLAQALNSALLIIEKAKPYVIEHAQMTCEDMKGLGGDAGDAYWVDMAETFVPKAKALLG